MIIKAFGTEPRHIAQLAAENATGKDVVVRSNDPIYLEAFEKFILEEPLPWMKKKTTSVGTSYVDADFEESITFTSDPSVTGHLIILL